MGHDGFTKIATFSDRARAEMMQELLQGEGIAALVRIDDGGGFQPQLAYGLGVSVEVREDQKAEALELLRNYGGLDDDEE
jgi:type III secretory pathway lipoprotein EscJ